MPPQTLNAVLRNWKAAGSLPLREYAPLAAHCLEVDLFFELCLSNGLISDQRPSNKIDISYLYYLPFADFFVSGDKLHRTAAPLFMDTRQRFVWGPDLKADLAARSEEHTSELQSLMRSSYAVFCLKKKNI